MSLAVLTLAACGGPPQKPPEPAAPPPQSQPPPPAPPPVAAAGCFDATYSAAAARNAASLRTLPQSAFGRLETGWEIYAPRMGQAIGSGCAPDSSGFARQLAAWQAAKAPPADGIVTEPLLLAMKAAWRAERPIAVRARGTCPDPPPESALETGRPGEGYGGKIVQLRHGAFAAYRAMVAAAKAERPEIAADPRNLTIFSAYRSPEYDAARCARDGNCDGIARAVSCSPHRTGLALDLYVGEAPGFGPDSTADPNRLAQTKTPTYRWLLANAHRFGFVNYPFEPWHWEWTGEAP
jgi:zinc D-Ala-D-Ala carboxypeptidase